MITKQLNNWIIKHYLPPNIKKKEISLFIYQRWKLFKEKEVREINREKDREKNENENENEKFPKLE